MPQLMPLMWMFSSIMFVFLLLMSYYLYYMKSFMVVIDVLKLNNDLGFVKLGWEW